MRSANSALLGTGMPRRRALALNYASAFAIVPGAVGRAFLWSSALGSAVEVLLQIAPGGFLFMLSPISSHRCTTGAAGRGRADRAHRENDLADPCGPSCRGNHTLCCGGAHIRSCPPVADFL